MKRPKTLSAAFVRTVNQPGRYGDGRGGFGLSLLVKPMANGRLSKSWSQRLRRDGRPYNIGIRSYPLVSLSEARAKALRNARDNAQGRDLRGDGIPTFRQAADAVIRLHRESWRGTKSECQWRQSLERHAFPVIGDKRVDEITTSHVLGALVPIWTEKHETAKRVHQRIGVVMRWAIAQGHRLDDPAHAATAVLPRNGNTRPVHHAALPHAEVGDALKRVRASGAPSATLCLEFLILTAARSGEARGATWDEIDSESATWTIPGARMKAGYSHKIPLSGRALAILAEVRALSDGPIWCFLLVGRARLLTAGRSAEPSKMQGSTGTTVHGLRSSFRDWCADTGQPREIAEAALAHIVGGVEGAYFRSDLFETAAGAYGRIGALRFGLISPATPSAILVNRHTQESARTNYARGSRPLIPDVFCARNA